MRVVRVIVYDGPEEWLETQMAKSLPPGKQPFLSDRHLSASTSSNGTVTITTVIDERPSQSLPTDPIILQAIEDAMKTGDE